MQLTYFELTRLKYRPCVNDAIETTKGRRFRCIAFGKQTINKEYQDCYIYREYNTENIPEEFTITPDKYNEAMTNKKIFTV